MILFADICGTQDAHPFGVCGHKSVFDSVVHHLDEVAGSVWPAVQVTQLGGALNLLATWSGRYLTASWTQSLKDWIEATNYFGLASDHHAVTALKAPYATAGS